MKKIIFAFLMLGCLFCVSCSSKEAPAEIKLIDENQEEITYQISKTDQPEEVKEVFEKLNSAKLDTSFNGFSLNLKTELEGKVIITGKEVRTIDLGYIVDVEAQANLKKYRMQGKILLDGFTNTDSDSLSLNTKNKLSLEFVNDDDYAYLKGSLDEEGNRLSLKNKVNIRDFTKNYKAIVTSYIDLMKYYKPLDFIPDISSLIDEYHITICKTTSDSFTLRLQLPANLIFEKLDTDLTMDIDIEMSCANLLPIRLEFQADDIISLVLENDYVEKYLSSTVKVEKAKLKVNLKLEYDYFEIKELTEAEKTTYNEYIIPNYE